MSIDIEGDRGPLTAKELREAANASPLTESGILAVEVSTNFEGADPSEPDEEYDEEGEELSPEEVVEVLVDEADRQTLRHAYLFALANRGATTQETVEFLTPLVDFMGARISQIAAGLFQGDPDAPGQNE